MKLKFLDLKDLRSKKPADVEKYIQELKTSHSELVHALSTNKETKTHQLGQIKKAIARAKTVQSTVQKEEK